MCPGNAEHLNFLIKKRGVGNRCEETYGRANRPRVLGEPHSFVGAQGSDTD
jgi:hypothetical protein